MGERVTVIVPIYNVEQYLRPCLDSIIGQTYKNLEIILVDDGSPDHCGAICDEYAAQDERITVIHKENGGVNTARNRGIERATGKWIAFVDSDDWLERDYYENMMKFVTQDMDVLYAGGYNVDYLAKTEKVVTFSKSVIFTSDEDINTLRRMILMPHRGRNVAFGYPFDKLYSADFLNRYALGFDTQLKAWDDMWTNFKFFAFAKKIATCTVIGYHYRQVMTSITKGFNPQKSSTMYQVLTAFREYAQEHTLSPEIMEAMSESAISAFSTAIQCDCFHPLNPKTYRERAAFIQDMKSWPLYQISIRESGNTYLNWKLRVLKYALRLPWIWPLRLLYAGHYRLQEKAKRQM